MAGQGAPVGLPGGAAQAAAGQEGDHAAAADQGHHRPLDQEAGGQQQGGQGQAGPARHVQPGQESPEGGGGQGGGGHIQHEAAGFAVQAQAGEQDEGGCGAQDGRLAGLEAAGQALADAGGGGHQQGAEEDGDEAGTDQGGAEGFETGPAQPIEQGRLLDPGGTVEEGHQPFLAGHHLHGGAQAQEVFVLAGEGRGFPDAQAEQHHGQPEEDPGGQAAEPGGQGERGGRHGRHSSRFPGRAGAVGELGFALTIGVIELIAFGYTLGHGFMVPIRGSSRGEAPWLHKYSTIWIKGWPPSRPAGAASCGAWPSLPWPWPTSSINWP